MDKVKELLGKGLKLIDKIKIPLIAVGVFLFIILVVIP